MAVTEALTAAISTSGLVLHLVHLGRYYCARRAF